MKINVIALGDKMPATINQLVAEYSKRLPSELKLHWHEIPLQKRSKSMDLAKIQAIESEKILAKIEDHDHVVALDEKGELWNTHQLSQHLQSWMQHGKTVHFLIGAPEGLTAPCKARANQIWSLSPLTFPHPLVRPLLVEQLYRAWTILNNHPYHRD